MTGRDIKANLDILGQAGYTAMRTIVARLLEMDDRDRMLLRIQTEAAHGAEPAKLRGLWTAWCLTTGSVPGLPVYEAALDGVIQDFPGTLDRGYMAQYVNEAYGLRAEAQKGDAVHDD